MRFGALALRTTKWVGLLLAFGVLFAIAAVGLLGALLPNAVTLPAPTGPHRVGRAAYDWTDATRLDPFAPESGTHRGLTVWIWYPADPTAEAERADYMPPSLLRARQESKRAAGSRLIRWFTAITDYLTTDEAAVTVHALEDAPLASGAPFPVVLFKPALGYFALQHTVLAENLASYGYVVVASDSPYTTPLVVYQDGRVVRRNAAGSGRVPPQARPGMDSAAVSYGDLTVPHPLAPTDTNGLLLPVIDAWVDDERFLLDRLTELNAADTSGRFAGALDLNAVGAFGHSFGGATAAQWCSEDPRCKAGVNIDGGLWGEVVQTGIGKPFLFVFSDRPFFKMAEADRSAESAALSNALRFVQAGLPNQPKQIVIPGTRHFNFTDYALFNEPHLFRLLGAYGPIAPQQALALANQHVRTFFDRYLRRQAPDPAD